MNDEVWAIHRIPEENPDGYTIRKWDIFADKMTCSGQGHAIDLPAAREIIPEGKRRRPREATDDPTIVEVWT